MLLSWFTAAHIRRQMMGMEPKQIARVVRQQEALFSSVYEGADCGGSARVHYRHQS